MAKATRTALLFVIIFIAAVCFGGIRPLALTAVPPEAVEYNGHYYMIYGDLADFEKPSYALAKKFCQKRGGHLAVIDDPAESVFLHEYIQNAGYDKVFFGLQFKDGSWEWVDGSEYEFSHWAENASEGSKKNPHGYLLGSSESAEWRCEKFGSSSMLYLCEWDEGLKTYSYNLEFAKEYVPEHTTLYNGSRYKVINCSLNRNDAANMCRNLGGHLVSISDKAENDFLMELIASEGRRGMYWIGAYYDSELLMWEWLGDDRFSYRNWSGGDPKFYTYNVKYAAINGSLDRYELGGWVAETETGRTDVADQYYTNFGFICEWDIVCGDNFYHGQLDREVSVDPTCTSEGLVRCFCTECDNEIYDTELPMLAHKYVQKRLLGHISVPGLDSKKCIDCGDKVREIDVKKIWFMPTLLLTMLAMTTAFVVTWVEQVKKRDTAAKLPPPPIWILLMTLFFNGLTMFIIYEIFIA